jgi:hypothetical protein
MEASPLPPPEEVLDVAGSDVDTPSVCVGDAVTPNPVPANILLLVDTSGSMEDEFEPPELDMLEPGAEVPEPESKWELTRAALTEAFTALPLHTKLGLVLFPDTEAEDAEPGCFGKRVALPLSDLSNTEAASSFIGELQTVIPAGDTPTHDAYDFALQHLLGTALEGNQYIVLITDGAPSRSLGCLTRTARFADPTPLIEATSAAFDVGVRTYVVGSPGSEEPGFNDMDPRISLSEMALAGRTGLSNCQVEGPDFCHYDMSQELDLGRALTDVLVAIAGEATGCTFDLPAPPDGQELNRDQVNVVVEGQDGSVTPVFKDATGLADCVEGWRYSEDESQVELCSSSCAQASATAGTTVRLEFGCATQVR